MSQHQPQPSLDELGRKYGTDKSSKHHNYLAFYERFFEKFRHKPITMLEIGIADGASLRVWHDYFTLGNIIGADINSTAVRFPRSRINVEILDQSNVEDLVKVGLKYGPFDIIVEDGSHLWEHQITTLKTLFPFLQDGGIYVVEDLQTNYGSMSPSYRGISSISCVEYLKRWVDLRVSDEQIEITREEDPFLRTYGHAIGFISFVRHACLIEKAYPERPVGIPSAESLIPLEGKCNYIPLAILAHVGGRGDRWHETGLLRDAKVGQNIQGFQIENLSKNVIDLSYRARLRNGTWTHWAAMGEFVGSRGEGNDLSGFAVRLDSGEALFNLEIAGIFLDETEPVIVCGYGDCVPNGGSGTLSGMQVTVHARSTPI